MQVNKGLLSYSQIPGTALFDMTGTKSAGGAQAAAITNGVAMSALPRPKALVDAAVRVVRGLCARQLLLHAAHTSTEAVAAGTTFGLWRLEVSAGGVVVGLTASGVQAAFRVLTLLALPCWSLHFASSETYEGGTKYHPSGTAIWLLDLIHLPSISM